MNSIVCTLFEGHYHFGVAALTNSLYHQGFKGHIYAGFRGALPPWCTTTENNPALNWPGSQTFQVAQDLHIHFLPLETDYHLTNYKPQFMLRLWNGPAKDADAIAYFDPDIVIKCNWKFYESWMSHGVALVHEIVANDMPATHPLRQEWHKVINTCGFQKNREITSYINGGFCGVIKENINFLHVWDKIQEVAIAHYGLAANQFMPYDRTHIFYAGDQDALNIAAMCSDVPISEVGPEGMDFIHGGCIMSHAVGAPKPWRKQYVLSVLKGIRPTLADHNFWRYANGPIKTFTANKRLIKKQSISIASLLGRFFSRY